MRLDINDIDQIAIGLKTIANVLESSNIDKTIKNGLLAVLQPGKIGILYLRYGGSSETEISEACLFFEITNVNYKVPKLMQDTFGIQNCYIRQKNQEEFEILSKFELSD